MWCRCCYGGRLVHSRTHPRPLAHAGLGVLGRSRRSEGVQIIATIGAIGPMRRLVAEVLSFLLAWCEDPRRSATRLHASKEALL